MYPHFLKFSYAPFVQPKFIADVTPFLHPPFRLCWCRWWTRQSLCVPMWWREVIFVRSWWRPAQPRWLYPRALSLKPSWSSLEWILSTKSGVCVWLLHDTYMVQYNAPMHTMRFLETTEGLCTYVALSCLILLHCSQSCLAHWPSLSFSLCQWGEAESSVVSVWSHCRWDFGGSFHFTTHTGEF